MKQSDFMKYSIYVILLTILISCSSEDNSIPVQQEDYCGSITRNDSINLSSELSYLDSLMEIKTGVYVLEDGGSSIISRAWFSEYAEKTIDIQYFIFSADNLGLIACDYLVRAANRGVKVRILVDDIMVDGRAEDLLIMDSHENINIKIYNPGVNLGKSLVSKLKHFVTDFRNANQRMHNKTFAVDDRIVITGGRNISNEYFDYSREFNYRDRDVLLIGKETKQVNSSFEEFWTSDLSVNTTELVGDKITVSKDSSRFDNLYQYACNPDNFWPQLREKISNYPTELKRLVANEELIWLDSIAFVSDIPGKNDGTEGIEGGGVTTSALVDLVNGATKSIDIQSPYLITTEESRALFKAAINKGIKIRILTNSLGSTDNIEAFSGYQRDRKDLLETGVQIFEFRPDAQERSTLLTGELQQDLETKPIFGLHAKTMVIDDEITVIGTFNLDPRSSNLNTECITIIKSEKIASEVLAGMKDEYKPENSWETTLDYNPDGEVSVSKQVKTWSRKIVPKGIL